MSWIFTKARRIRKARAPSGNAKEILERLRHYLDNEASEPVKLLCGFWEDQQKAITYQELREIVLQGWLDEETARLWEGDYAYFVKETMPKIWGQAMIAGSISQPVMESSLSAFQFNTQTPGVVEWMRSRGAYLVTNCTQGQKDAIALLLEDKMRNTHTPDELARLIRPTIGLTRPQTAAVRNYYDNLVKTLTEANPNRSVAEIKATALKKATQYAERQHRQRALTIAQTEMAYAYNYGADEGIRQAQTDFLIGKVEKRWCTSGDEQVCEECEKLDGQQIGMDEIFFSGNKVEYDISGLYPPLHPRCACAVEYIETEEPLPERQPQDVTDEYRRNAQPGTGSVTADDEYIVKGHEEEIAVAERINNYYGGDIRLLTESKKNMVSMPDYEWQGRLWDLKSPKGIKNAGKLIQKGLSQISDNPGGIILNLSHIDDDLETVIRVVNGRMKLSNKTTTDVIFFKNGAFLKVLRYIK